MAREKDPNRELAFKLWRENQEITNREIAKTLEVDEKKIATWKSRDKWKERVSSPEKEATTIKKNKCSTTKQETVVQQKNVVQQIEEESKKNKEKIIEEISEEVLNDDGLTENQRLFCVYYMQSFNATQSAIKAGYAKTGARTEGYRLLANAYIKKYLTELKEKYAQEDYMESKRLLERHKQIAFSNLNDYINGEGKLKDLSATDGTLIKKVTVKESSTAQGYSTSSSIELEDRSKSLDFLNKFYGIDPAFKMQIEKLEIERNKVKSMDERNRILENANKPPSSRVEDMTEHELDNYLKKYGGA
ncbi:terminase small subunit [Cetobacterium sp.]|uniref:terminase small subunit n=1 Tax=Cetobacterium sp. TaxID=2071632 RepID=UPI003F2B777F